MKIRIERLPAYLFALVLALAACSPPAAVPVPTAPPAAPPSPPSTTTPPERAPVIIDSDMSPDAVMAILYVLQRPELEVKAITVAGTGEAHCEPGMLHAAGLAAIADAGEIPVACGRDKPLAGHNRFPTEWRKMVDGDMGIAWPAVGELSNPGAVELITRTLASANQPVVVMTDGPLTNIAEVLQTSPELSSKIKMIYIMGGAIDVPGNIMMVPLSAPNSTAEFNIFVDPHAASLVLQSGAPITLVPLDVTNQVPLDNVFYKILSDNLLTPEAKMVHDLLTGTGMHKQFGNSLWDPLAYAIASDESLATIETRKIRVIEENGPEIGRTKADENGAEVRVALKTNPDVFIEQYVRVLNGGQEVSIDWEAVKAPPENLVTVTIKGGKCTLEGPLQMAPGEVGIKLIIPSEEKAGAIAAVTLDSGRTFADIDAWPSTDPPAWLEIVGLVEADPQQEYLIPIELADKPVYIVCFEGPPAAKIGVVGPIEPSASAD